MHINNLCNTKSKRWTNIKLKYMYGYNVQPCDSDSNDVNNGQEEFK